MTIRVLASVIQRNQKLLVCRRPRHKRHGGLWEFPSYDLAPSDRRYVEFREGSRPGERH